MTGINLYYIMSSASEFFIRVAFILIYSTLYYTAAVY